MRQVVHDWLNAMACQALGWHGLRFEPPPPDEGARFRMEQGQEVGDCARHLYPERVLIRNVAGRMREEVTKQFMADPNVQTLFEPTAEATPFIAKADILTRFNGGWHVLEVKSSFPDTGGIDARRDDLAYTVMVAQRAGLLVTKASLVLLSRGYRFGGEVRQLFDTVDQTADTLARAAQFDKVAAALVSVAFDLSGLNSK